MSARVAPASEPDATVLRYVDELGIRAGAAVQFTGRSPWRFFRRRWSVGRDNGAEAKVAAAVAMTAALFSPRVRGLLRRGAVHGLAGALTAGEAIAAFARGVSRGIEDSTGAARRAGPPGVVANEPPDGAPVAVPAPAAGGAAVPGTGSRPPRRTRARPPAAPATSTGGDESDE